MVFEGTHRADVVGPLNAILCVPLDAVLVGELGGNKGRAVVTAHADEHET